MYLDDKPENEYIQIRNTCKKAIACLLISSTLIIIIPKESTMYKMIIANELTYEKVNFIVETVNDKVDKIMEIKKQNSQ